MVLGVFVLCLSLKRRTTDSCPRPEGELVENREHAPEYCLITCNKSKVPKKKKNPKVFDVFLMSLAANLKQNV